MSAGSIPARSSGSQALTFTLCLLVTLVEGYDLATSGVAAPKVGPLFHLSPAQMSWFFSASTLGLFVGSIVGGRLADRFGRRAVLIWSVVLFGVFSLATALAWDFNGLLFARLLTGLGLGGSLPNAIALTAEAGAARTRAMRTTAMAGGMPFGGAACGIIALIYGPALSWQAIFIIGGLFPLGLGAVLVFALPESEGFKGLRATSATTTPGIGRALFAERRAASSVLLWISFLLTLSVSYMMISWLPSLIVAKGFTGRQGAMVSGVYNFCGGLGALGFGYLLTVGPRRLVLLAAFVGMAIAALALSSVHGGLSTVVVAAAVLGFFVNAAQFLLYGMSPTFYPLAMRGTGVGAAVAAGRIGAFAGPLLAGAVLTAGYGPSGVLGAMLPITALALIVTVGLAWRRPLEDSAHSDAPEANIPVAEARLA
jgi:AAHS family 3-hydroxyphenylpropionic acid transporter